MKKQRLFSLLLACAAGSASAAILWQDPQEAYAAGYFHYANADYIQELPHEPQAAAKLGQLWGLFAQEASEALASPQWRGWQRAEQLYRDGNYQEALQAFLPQAEAGNILAGLRVYQQYVDGKGTVSDDAQARRWFEETVTQLHAQAYPLYDAFLHSDDAETHYQLGQMYLWGAGVREDYNKAADIMQVRAAAGHAEAMDTLADLYADGWGVAPDPAQAIHWREQAATHGDAAIRYATASWYRDNAKNDGRARYWYEQVAADGKDPLLTAMALDDLHALATLRGDTAQAQTWRDRAITAWRPLATRGDLYAQSRLGELLLQRGQAIDLPQAREWLEKAAAQGDAAAEKHLQEWHDGTTP